MITEKIKALFNFIEFLHSNIDNFKQYETLISEVYALKSKRNELSPQNNFKDKLSYDEIQKELIVKFEIIENNIIKLIQSKVNELNICDWNKTESLWNNNIEEISNIKRDFSYEDVSEIFEFKNKYLEYRKKTNCDYFQTFFFPDLDTILKELFDFFKEPTTENEFEAFETKPLKVNDLFEVITLFKDGHNSFEIPNFILNKTKEQAPISYIKESDKDLIFNKLVFNKGLFYFSDIHKNYIQTRYRDLEKNFETKIDFEKAVNSLLHSNGLHFYSKLRTISNETEFIKFIESQYNLYNEYTPDNSLNWLNFTKKAIMYGFGILRIDNEGLKASFMTWYNETIEKIKQQKPTEPQNNKLHFNEFSDFLDYFKMDALAVDLRKENINVFELLQTQQNKFKTADLASEIDEVREYSKKAMGHCKNSLNVAFINNHYKGKLIGATPHFLVDLKLYLEYKDLCEKTILKENQQAKCTEVLYNDEVKKELHNHIFKDNAFTVWTSLFENFKINETKRTDLRFMYEIMKYNEQIHKTVTVKHITDWINDTYEFSVEKLQYTNIKSKSNENRMSIYNLIK